MENSKKNTTFIIKAQNFFAMKVALFLGFWAFWTLNSVFVKSWLWGLGAPPVFNRLTSNQAQIGSFSHLYQPWDLGQNLFELSCPIVHLHWLMKTILFLLPTRCHFQPLVTFGHSFVAGNGTSWETKTIAFSSHHWQ